MTLPDPNPSAPNLSGPKMSGPTESGGLVLDRVVVGYHRSRLGHHQTEILRTETVAAAPGGVTALIGANGTGKSTLLRTLVGLQPTLGGTAELGADDLFTLSPRRRAQRVAAVLTDRIDDGGFLTAKALVEIGRTPYHRWLPGQSDDDTVVTEALARLGASHLAQRRVGELSDGQRQRVMIARALAQQPELLILDEPSSFLDAAARTELLLILRELAADTGIVVLMSTHDVELALRLIDAVWLARRDGTLVSATNTELLTGTTIGAEFDSATVRFNRDTGNFEPRSWR